MLEAEGNIGKGMVARKKTFHFVPRKNSLRYQIFTEIIILIDENMLLLSIFYAKVVAL